jgi:eukaryotic-like serine/threonine-protein kinase
MTLLGGRYTVGEMIGTGGMADVYIAQDERLARKVAVKICAAILRKIHHLLRALEKKHLLRWFKSSRNCCGV